MKAEIAKERRLLEEDKKELEQLEQALKDEEVRRQRQNKSLHTLAKRVEQIASNQRAREQTPEIACKDTRPPFRDLEDDRGLGGLLQQLHSHLDSIHNNTARIAEIPSAMTASQAALDSFTWRFLDQERYDKLHGLDFR